MQTEVPTLPFMCTNGHKCSTREPEVNARNSRVDVKNPLSKGPSFLSNRKQLHPLVGGPYRNSMRLYALSEPVRSTNKSTVVQRVTSAKMLRVKQLQNQLTDAHYHLNELANENRLLKALQKRQDSALKRYEGTNAELPRIINSHHEELKVLQTKYKKLRNQHKQTCDMLKEKENEIHSLQSQNKHLMQLSKDRHLEERNKLQMRVSDLNFRIEQQQETIQTLNRKLALESKSLKHQLNVEVAKHKETQKHLHEALDKLKNLEDLLDNREKRLYYSGRLPICNKGKTMASQSLMNLGNNSVPTNPPKSGNKSKGQQNDIESGSLPKLIRSDSNDGKTIPNLKPDSSEISPVTETMSSLQLVRKFRLQKPYSRNGSAGLINDVDKSDDEEVPRRESSGLAKLSSFEKIKAKRAATNDRESEDEETKKIVEDFEITNGKGPYKLPKQLMREFGYSSSESDSEGDTKNNGDFEHETNSLTNKSRELHNRLIDGNTTFIDPKKSKQKNRVSTSESESDCEKQMKNQSTRKNSYSIVLKKEIEGADDNHTRLSVDDFLKLDINATDSDLEMERLRKTKVELSEKSLKNPVDDFLTGYESSEQRLMTITKSWTELQEKIKRDREMSENQLRSLTDENSSDAYLLEKKLTDLDDIVNSGQSRRSSLSGNKSEKKFDPLEDTHRRINESSELSIDVKVEIPHEQQNGIIKDSINVNEKNPNIEISKRYEINVDTSEKKIEETTKDLPVNNVTESNGIASKEIDETSTDTKMINYNKQKLLAAMKAIDDNENIEFLSNQKHRGSNQSIHSQTTISDNLYRGFPSHARKKDDIMKELFGDAKTQTKFRAGCSKIH